MSSFEAIPLNSPSLHYLHPSNPDRPTPPPHASDDGQSAVLTTAKSSDWWHTLDVDSQSGLAWGKWVDLHDEGFELKGKASIKQQNRVSSGGGTVPDLIPLRPRTAE